MRSIILASTSRYRRALLERLGNPFEVASPDYEETERPGLSPTQLVLTHARGKAGSLVTPSLDALVIGSDQVVSVGDDILGKPGTKEGAIRQLQAMAGHEHQLVTAVTVMSSPDGAAHEHVDVTRIRLRDLSRAEIEAYVERENPVDCAGSYKAEELGPSLFEYQRGDDPTAVVGLPLIGLCRLLREFGIDVVGGR